MLLQAKQDLRLDRALKRLRIFEAVILDDIGYVQHDRDEIEAVVPSVLQRDGRTAAWRREEDGKREDLSSRNQGMIIVVIREK